VLAASWSVSAAVAASSAMPSFGPNVYFFNAAMPQSEIQSTVDAIAAEQVSNQFGGQRLALLFEPGTYGTPAHPLTSRSATTQPSPGSANRRQTS